MEFCTPMYNYSNPGPISLGTNHPYNSKEIGLYWECDSGPWTSGAGKDLGDDKFDRAGAG
jgi:hypothetical protein